MRISDSGVFLKSKSPNIDFKNSFLYNINLDGRKLLCGIIFEEVTDMFKITICDDEEILIHTLKENLDRYAADTEVDFCYQTYSDGSELLAK